MDSGAGPSTDIGQGPPPLFTPQQLRTLRTVIGKSPLYVTENMFIGVVVYTNVPGVVTFVSTRGARLDGEPLASTFNVNTPTPAAPAITYFRPGESLLYSVTAFVTSFSVHVGAVYVEVFLFEGTIPAPAIALGMLTSGFVTSAQVLSYPQSPVRTSQEGGANLRAIVGSTPGGFSEMQEIVPTGVRWRLVNFYGTFTSNVNVTNWTARLLAKDPGGHPLWESWFTPATINLNTQLQCFWLPGLGFDRGNLFGTDFVTGLQSEIWLTAGSVLTTITVGIANGNWQAPNYTVIESIDV